MVSLELLKPRVNVYNLEKIKENNEPAYFTLTVIIDQQDIHQKTLWAYQSYSLLYVLLSGE
jgi:hypothetical protein